MNIRPIEEIVAGALKKELVRLSGVADRAKAAVDDHLNVGTEWLAIHEELREIVNSKKTGKVTLDRLAALKDRDAKVNKIQKKDLVKLIDKQSKAEIERDSLISEISMTEWRLSMRKAG